MGLFLKLFVIFVIFGCKPPTPGGGAQVMSVSGKKVQKCPVVGSVNKDGYQFNYVVAFESAGHAASIENVKVSGYSNKKKENGTLELGPGNGNTYKLKALAGTPGAFALQNPNSQNALFTVVFQDDGSGKLTHSGNTFSITNWKSCKDRIGP